MVSSYKPENSCSKKKASSSLSSSSSETTAGSTSFFPFVSEAGSGRPGLEISKGGVSNTYK
eukprot:scaffold85505_cov37-Cyclotella_meneghiniana.AAC.2